MKITVTQNYEDLSQVAAQEVVSAIYSVLLQKERCVLVPSSGGTPLGLYKALREHYRDAVDWQDVIIFEMDEYLGLPNSHPNSYSHYLYHELVQPLGIREYYFMTDPSGKPQLTPEQYRKLLQEFGIDVVINGVGENGHLGFNEPGSPAESETRIVELTESTRRANARFFKKLSHVPTHAMTMGLKELIQAYEHIVIISGERKQKAVKQIFQQPISESCPASLLRGHERVHFIIDAIAAGDANLRD